MKKILLYIAVLGLSVFAIDRVSFYCIKKGLLDQVLSGGSSGYINYLTRRKQNADFLVLGNSRAHLHINPDMLTGFYGGNGYNAAMNSVGGLFYNHVVIDMLLQRGIKPKAFLLQTDAYQFSDDSKEMEIGILFGFLGENAVLDRYARSVDYRTKVLLAFRLFRCNNKLFNLLYNYRKRGSVADNNGYEYHDEVMDPRFDKVDTTRVKTKNKFREDKVEALRALYQSCQSNGIQLYIITTPSYRNNVRNIDDDGQLVRLVKEMPGAHLLMMNNIDQYPQISDYHYWRDVNHLNDKGATIFSRILNDSLQNIK